MSSEFYQVVRIQCKKSEIKDDNLFKAQRVTLLHHCDDVDPDWRLLFQGQVKSFLNKKKEMAFLKLRPHELERFLKWHPAWQTKSWDLVEWNAWGKVFAQGQSLPLGSPQAVWDVVEEARYK